MERYSRQIELLGRENQEKLQRSKVLVIGTGGLGSPAVTAMAVSGIKTLGIVDSDKVEISNLNRQTLHTETNINRSKTSSALERVQMLNRTLEVKSYNTRLDSTLAEEIFPSYDLIISCVDNYETRSIVSKIAVKLGITVIEGGIEGFDAFVQIIIPGKTPCFNCLYTGGTEIYRQVVGAATGIIGSMQALEAIKQLTGLWKEHYNYLAIDLVDYSIDTIKFEAKTNCSCQIK